MGDGTGAVMLDGKMEDDASLKQCLVMVELAEQLAAIDPRLKAQYDAITIEDLTTPTPRSTDFRPRRSDPLHAQLQRAGAGEGQDAALRRHSSSTSRTQSPPTPSRPPATPRAPPPRSRGVRPPRADHPGQRCRHRVARRRHGRGVRRRARTRSSCPRWTAPRRRARPSSSDGRTTHPSTRRSGRWSRRRTRCSTRRRSRPGLRPRLTVLVMGTNDLVKELYAEHVPGRQPVLAGLSTRPARRACYRQGHPRRRLQRREGHRRLPGRVHAGPADGLRRQDAHPPRPGRGRQRGLRPQPAGGRDRPRDPRGLGGPHLTVVTHHGRLIETLHVESAQRTLSIHDAIGRCRPEQRSSSSDPTSDPTGATPPERTSFTRVGVGNSSGYRAM